MAESITEILEIPMQVLQYEGGIDTDFEDTHGIFFFTLKVSWSFKSSASNFAVLVLTGLKVIRPRQLLTLGTVEIGAEQYGQSPWCIN